MYGLIAQEVGGTLNWGERARVNEHRMYMLYSILLYLSLCRSDVARPYIWIFLIPFLYLDVCILCVLLWNCQILLSRYYCTVGARNTSNSPHLQKHLRTACLWPIKCDLIWSNTSNTWFAGVWCPSVMRRSPLSSLLCVLTMEELQGTRDRIVFCELAMSVLGLGWEFG